MPYTKLKTEAISARLGHPQTPFIIDFGRDNPLFTVGALKQEAEPKSTSKKAKKK